MLTLEDYEKLNPRCELVHEGVQVRYATPTAATKWRVDTLFQKEPVTVAWIAGFERGSVLVDIGANMGLYTIWAAKTRGARVYAFEPEAQNYALLNRNIALNALDDRVRAFCLALSDTAGPGDLHLSALGAGESCHALNEVVDFQGQPMRPVFSQGCMAARLDDLVGTAVPFPDYIKLDVDGIEPRIIAGARQVLADRRVRSVLVETNPARADHRDMVEDLQRLGFRYDPAQVAAATRKSGPFKGVAEYVFVR